MRGPKRGTAIAGQGQQRNDRPAAWSTIEKPDYGNWVSRKMVWLPGGLALAALAASFFYLLALAAFFFFLVPFLYFSFARRALSKEGGDIQNRIIGLLLSNLEWDGEGRMVDIGCGNGPLTIAIAQRYPAATVTGIDYWGARWDYSMALCERNAGISGVADRVSFRKASASALLFEDGAFEAAVSNLCFHEVADAKDKREVVREALRVVKKGGRFAFQDLFLLKSAYGEPEELLATIRSWGIEKVELVRTNDAAFVPAWLKLPFMVGRIAILRGEK